MTQYVSEVTAVSTKGQVVLPKIIRDALQLDIGAKLMAFTDGENILLKPIKAPSMDEFASLLDAAEKWAQDVSLTWHAKMKGSVTKDYSAYKITTGSDTQDLALVFGEAVDKEEKYVEIDVTWVQKSKLTVVKTDAAGKRKLSGAVFGVYSDAACTKLITQMPATDANGSSTVELDVTGTVYLKELTPPMMKSAPFAASFHCSK